MPASEYSFIDIAVLDDVRGRFAAGDALAILSTDLEEVIWANGPGARMFGYPDIEAIMGAAAGLGLAQKRQISATPGYPEIGTDRPLLLRLSTGLTSRAVSLVGSAIRLPDGERAILLAAPAAAAGARDPAEIAARAISGFTEAGYYAAFLRSGRIAASAPGFDDLGIAPETVAALVADVADATDRLVKRRIPAAGGRIPAGIARLLDEPAVHLLVVVDDPEFYRAADFPEDVSVPSAGQSPLREQAPPSAPATVAAPIATVRETRAAEETDVQRGAPAAAPRDGASRGNVDRWYFEGDASPVVAAPESSTDGTSTGGLDPAGGPDEAVETSIGLPPAEEPASQTESEPGFDAPAEPSFTRLDAPVRFAWRTDAAGRFSAMSREFLVAVKTSEQAVIGRSFAEVAAELGIDPDGEIDGLLARRDTWSGRTVLWPLGATGWRAPVDLAALPVYARDRRFEGFRGFGIARLADSVFVPMVVPAPQEAAPGEGAEPDEVAPEAVGPEHASDQPVADREAASAPAATGESAEAREQTPSVSDTPGIGATTVIPIDEARSRRFSDKIIRLAEHRAPSSDRNLSPGERNAFREIGDRLKKVTEPRDEPEVTGETARPGQGAGPAAAAGDEKSAFDAAEAGSGHASSPSGAPGSAIAEEPAPGAGPLDKRPGSRPSNPFFVEVEEELFEEAIEAPETGSVSVEPAEPVSGEVDVHPSADTENGAADTSAPDAPSSGREPSEPRSPAAGFLPSAFAEALGAPSDPGIGRTILARLPLPMLVHAGDVLHFANRSFLDFTGYATLAELEGAGGLGALFAEPGTAPDQEDAPEHSALLRQKGGSTMPVHAHLQSIPWGRGKALLLALRQADLPHPEMAEIPTSDLAARVEEMRTILDTATDGVVLIAPDGTIRSINRPAEALFGYDDREVAGKPFVSLLAVESQRAARDYLQGLSDNGVASVLNDGREVIGREAQGRFIPLFMTIGRLPGGNGFCAVLRDITPWKRAEEELTKARTLAERSSSQKSEFLARVSHEIRTPLNAIIGFSELMMDEKFGPIGNDRYRDYLRDINRSGNHVLDIVNDLLDISKIEAGEQEMSYEAVSLNEVLSETVAMMQPQANRERVIIRSSFASRLPEVVADLRSVRQIGLNLLSNAVRFTQPGGQVIVSTSYEASGDVVMRVRDTGVGMSSAEIEQALKPFKQINSLKRSRTDGTGLGLPLTKAMVEANRARFTINSTPGEGTLVEVCFPSTRVLAD
ncbi:MAG: histidine kinase dimerization/phospho-acceptor domain-containing protein [Mesorhizobium sp.]